MDKERLMVPLAKDSWVQQRHLNQMPPQTRSQFDFTLKTTNSTNLQLQTAVPSASPSPSNIQVN